MTDNRNTTADAGCALSQLDVARFQDGTWQRISDAVTEEVEIHVAWEQEAEQRSGEFSLLAWPRDLKPLALGHVLLDVLPEPLGLRRQATVVETGERSFRVLVKQSQQIQPDLPAPFASPESVVQAMQAFISASGHWDETGCFHRAGVFDTSSGALVTRAEDIGRHNCLDRLAGWAQLHDVALSGKALLTSARITGSYCAKALRAGFRLLVSRSAVTTQAIQLAEQAGASLAGFARPNEGRFTVFTDSANRFAYPG